MSDHRIEDYGFISDCHSAALVSREGSVDWYCVPRFDSPWIFGRLLDPDGGHWSIAPVGEYEQERAYEGETLVLRTVFDTPEGKVAVTDALALEQGSRGHDIGERVPHVLLRLVEGLEGDVDMHMEFAPRFEYALTVPDLRLADGGVLARGGPVSMLLFTDAPLEPEAGFARSSFTVRSGDSVCFALAYSPSFSEPGPKRLEVAPALADTARGWESWIELHQGYQGSYVEQVRRSALVLQGLTYQPSGAVVAAATSSLPEKVGGDANWDYRFAWLRDVSLLMRAQWIAACPDEPSRFFRLIVDASGQPAQKNVQIVYGVEGERDLTEHSLGHLAGFLGSRPVRVGNDAWKQKQLDVTGEVLDSAHLLLDQLRPLDDDIRRLLIAFADKAASSWQEPDSGMWEARDRERHYLSSKVMCWVALDRAVQMAEAFGEGTSIERWRQSRDQVREAVLRKGWSDTARAYTGAFGSDHLDASVLLMPLVGFLPATDERMRATIDAVERELGDGYLVRRWSGEPGGFVICTYWLVECLALAGEVERAMEWFKGVTAYANDLGLLSEEIDPDTGRLVGNFPQAFSHVGLVNAAWRLTEVSSQQTMDDVG